MSGRIASAQTDLTEGPVAGTLFFFSLPFMVSTILQQLYGATDTIIVGQYLGRAGLSAVSNGSQVMTMLYALVIGFATGGQVLIAQAKGAEDGEALQEIFETLFLVVVLVSLLIGAGAILLRGQILDLLETPEEARRQTEYYLMICGAGVLFTGLYNTFSAALRGLGDSRHPLLFVLVAAVSNLILDILFIAVFRFGVAGAALATVIGQGISVVFSAWFLVTHAETFHLDFHFFRWRLHRTSLKLLLKLGIPMALQSGAVQVSFLFVARMINRLGVEVSAAFGVMNKLRSFPGYLTQGFGLGAATMMGQNLGARRTDRVSSVVRWCLLFCLVVDALAAVLYLACPVFCFRLFTADSAVLAYAPMCTLVLAIELPANVFMPACNSLVSAQGFVKLSFTVGIIDAFAGRVLFCWLLGTYFGLGAFGCFLGYIIGTYITAVIVAFYYFSGLWKKRAALV
jgi:putative MATE family efflux protein